MDFKDKKVIPAPAIFRAANVSATRGKKVIEQLAEEGRITPMCTPTRRTNLSIRDGETVYVALVGCG
jgi:predicted transcriptional regulator